MQMKRETLYDTITCVKYKKSTIQKQYNIIVLTHNFNNKTIKQKPFE